MSSCINPGFLMLLTTGTSLTLEGLPLPSLANSQRELRTHLTVLLPWANQPTQNSQTHHLLSGSHTQGHYLSVLITPGPGAR